ncbi:MAG TPA: DsbA family protein [Alphaproteobacteria bacterium]|nr:DsbA family protein [Alphaproteobacteria bacterium]
MQNKSLLMSLLAGILGAVIVLGAQSLMKPAPTEGTTDVADEFGSNVREFLVANPEVIIEALQKHQENQQQAQLDAASEVIKAQAAAIFTNPASPVMGNPNGSATVVEFFDYNCGYCRRAAPDVEKLKAEDANLRVVHKHLPILGPESLEATKVALAARMQDPTIYEKLHHAFMKHEGKLDSTTIETLARESGANWEKILVDKESDAIKDEVKANYDIAQKLGLTGTPGFIVGTQFLPGAQPLEALKAAIVTARTPPAGSEPAAENTTADAPAVAPESTAVVPEAAPEAATPETPPAAPAE